MNILTVTLKTTAVMMVAAMLLLTAACGGERKTESKAGETKTAQAVEDVANVETQTAQDLAAARDITLMLSDIAVYIASANIKHEDANNVASRLADIEEHLAHYKIKSATKENFIGNWWDMGKFSHTEIEFREDGSFIMQGFDGGTLGQPTYGTWSVKDNMATVVFGVETINDVLVFVFNEDEEDYKTMGNVGELGRQWFKKEAETQPPALAAETFTDPRDNQTYRIVRIGNRTWFAQNLNFATNNSWCYDNDNSNCEKYGRLYTWSAATTACPAGWRLPTGAQADWEDLMTAVGGVYGEGEGEGSNALWDVAGRKLRSRTGWTDNNGNPMGNGTDDFGFSALPGGSRYGGQEKIIFQDIGEHGAWWRAEKGKHGVIEELSFLSMSSGDPTMVYDGYINNRYAPLESHAFSVRCVR